MIDDLSRAKRFTTIIYRNMDTASLKLTTAARFNILRKNNEVALIILDLAMPEKSGFKIFEMVKKEFPDIKILIASVFSENDQKAFLPDADEYYDKSEDLAFLIKKIEKLVKLEPSS